MDPIPAASLTGPTGKAAMVRFENIRLVGIGFLPLGWYRLIGCPANRWANKVGSVHEHPEFALLAKLHSEIRRLTDTEQMAALFDHMLLPSVIDPDPLEAEIERIHHNIANPDIGSVSELAAITGISQQRVERLARRVFGFPPKLLLRRQRFLRTLAKVMEHPDLKWSAALDDQYFDQAHFNREFQQFMGMTPRQYLAMPRSTSIITTQTRGRDLGHLLQALQGPGPLSGQ
jgi:AraC-like DNA-binding protein